MSEQEQSTTESVYLSHEEEMRLIAIQEEKAWKDHISSLTYLRKEGRKEEKLQAATNMLLKGLDIQLIVEITDLNESEVLELQAELLEATAAPTIET